MWQFTSSRSDAGETRRAGYCEPALLFSWAKNIYGMSFPGEVYNLMHLFA
jgi:hypothetical protein